MVAENVEIEIALKNPDFVKEFLNRNGNLKAMDVKQKDTYFTPAHRNFLEPEFPFEWLRIRETDKGSTINFKHFNPENVAVTHYCNEYETSIGDADQVFRIFSELNFKEIVIVDKVRSTWSFEDVEVAIDFVEGLGTFIELEAEGAFDDPKEGKKYLYDVLKKIDANLGDESFKDILICF